jgi:type IV pilus assembly protein PilM
MSKGIWGIDVSKYSVKAIRLEKGAGGCTLTHCKIIPFEGSETGEPGNADEQIKAALLDLKAQCRIGGGEKVVLSLPGHSTFNRLIKLPPVDDAKLPEVVKYEAQSQIPFNIDEVIWDYQFVQRQYGPGEEKEVILFAIKKDIVESFLKNIEDVGLNVEAVQFGPVALYNFIEYDQDLGGSAIALDMGADNTDLVIVDGSKFWVRNLPITGNDITKALQKAFNIPFGEAEKLKIKAGQSQQAQKIFNAIQPTLRDLVSEVQRSIGYYKSISKASKFDKIVLIGNSTKTLNFQKFVSQSLQMPAIRIAKMNKIAMGGGLDQAQFNEDLNTVGTAIGLAIQGFGDSSNKINLLPAIYHRKKELKKKQPWVAGAVAALLIMVLAMGFSAQGEVAALSTVLGKANGAKSTLEADRDRLLKASHAAGAIKCAKHPICAPAEACAGPLDKLVGLSVERDLPLRVLNLVNPNLPDNRTEREKNVWLVDWKFTEEATIKPPETPTGFGQAAPPKPVALDKRLKVVIEGCILKKSSTAEAESFVAKSVLNWDPVTSTKPNAQKPSAVDEFKLRRRDESKDGSYSITIKGDTSQILPTMILDTLGSGADEGDKSFARFVITLNIPIGEANRKAVQAMDAVDDHIAQPNPAKVQQVKDDWAKAKADFAHSWVMRTSARVAETDDKVKNLK